MRKKTNGKPVTNINFKKGINAVLDEIRHLGTDITTKDDFRRFSLTLLKTQEDVRHIKTAVGTKDDLRKISLEVLKTQEDLQTIKAIVTSRKGIKLTHKN